MDPTLKLYLIGLIVGVGTVMLISIQVADMLSSPSAFFKGIASTGAKIWLFGYLLIVVISLPFMAIESLKKRFSMKQFFPFPFMAGTATGFISFNLISMVQQALF